MALSKINETLGGGIEKSELPILQAELEILIKEHPEKLPDAIKLLKESLQKTPEDTKVELTQLISDFEWENILSRNTESEKYWFSALEKKFWSYMITKTMLQHFNDNLWLKSIDKKFWESLSTKEQDAINLVLWWRFVEGLQHLWQVTAEQVTGNIESGKPILNNLDDTEIQSLEEKVHTFLSSQDEIEKIQKTKGQHPDLVLTNSVVQSIVDDSFKPENIHDLEKGSEVYNTIVSLTEKNAETMNDINVSFGWILNSEIAKDSLASIKDDTQGIGWLLSILSFFIPGLKEFINQWGSEKEKNMIQSLGQLAELSQTSNSPIKWFFTPWFIDSVDVKTLTPFFWYLSQLKIDYSRKSFWKDIISGNTGNEKEKMIASLLKDEYGENIFTKKDTEDTEKSFVKKLNSIEKLANKEEVEVSKKQLQASAEALPIIPVMNKWTQVQVKREEVVEKTTNPHTTQETAEVESEWPKNEISNAEASPVLSEEEMVKIKQQYLKHRNTSIEIAIQESFDLPITIDYSWKEWELQELGISAPKSIDFHEGQLVIDNERYTIAFDDFVHETNMYITSIETHVNDLEVSNVSRLSKENIFLEVHTSEHQKTENKPLEKWEFVKIILWITTEKRYAGKILADANIPEIGFQVLPA